MHPHANLLSATKSNRPHPPTCAQKNVLRLRLSVVQSCGWLRRRAPSRPTILRPRSYSRRARSSAWSWLGMVSGARGVSISAGNLDRGGDPGNSQVRLKNGSASQTRDRSQFSLTAGPGRATLEPIGEVGALCFKDLLDAIGDLRSIHASRFGPWSSANSCSLLHSFTPARPAGGDLAPGCDGAASAGAPTALPQRTIESFRVATRKADM